MTVTKKEINTILKELICDKLNSKEIVINDNNSAFKTLGEKEVDIEGISPYDFEVSKPKQKEEKNNIDLGAFEFEFEKES